MSSNIAHILSAQEQALADGKKVLHGTATDRVLRMFETIRAGGQPRLALGRPFTCTAGRDHCKNRRTIINF